MNFTTFVPLVKIYLATLKNFTVAPLWKKNFRHLCPLVQVM